MTYLAETPPRTSYSFDDQAQKTLYVPEASVEAYKTSSYDWSNFGKILPPQRQRHQGRQQGRHRHERRERYSDPEQRALGRAPVSVYSTTGQLLGAGKGNISVDT